MQGLEHLSWRSLRRPGTTWASRLGGIRESYLLKKRDTELCNKLVTLMVDRHYMWRIRNHCCYHVSHSNVDPRIRYCEACWIFLLILHVKTWKSAPSYSRVIIKSSFWFGKFLQKIIQNLGSIFWPKKIVNVYNFNNWEMLTNAFKGIGLEKTKKNIYIYILNYGEMIKQLIVDRH